MRERSNMNPTMQEFYGPIKFVPTTWVLGPTFLSASPFFKIFTNYLFRNKTTPNKQNLLHLIFTRRHEDFLKYFIFYNFFNYVLLLLFTKEKSSKI